MLPLLASVLALAGIVIPLLATLVDPISDPASALTLAAQLWQGAQWAPLIALAVVAVVAAARRWGAQLWPWLGTRLGTLVLVGLAALAGSLLEALLSGAGLGVTIVINAVVAAIGAVGMHSGVKNGMQAVARG